MTFTLERSAYNGMNNGCAKFPTRRIKIITRMQVNFCYSKYCHYKNHLSTTVISKPLSIAHLFQAVVIATKLGSNRNRTLTASWV